jgi:hypothetical protein
MATFGATSDHLRSNQRLTLEKIRHPFRLRALKSDFGQAVLRDLDGAARCTHLRTKIVHLRDGDTGIVATTTEPEALKTSFSSVTNSRFSALSTAYLQLTGPLTCHGLPGCLLPLRSKNPERRSRILSPSRSLFTAGRRHKASLGSNRILAASSDAE